MKFIVIIFTLFGIALPACAIDSDSVVPVKTIYDSKVNPRVLVKTSNKQHVYFWYEDGSRCIAVANIPKISIACPDKRFFDVIPDGTDVKMIAEGVAIMTLPENSYLHNMYRAIAANE